MQDIREIQTILQVEQSEIASLWEATQQALDDQFVHVSTENGVGRWERILNIEPKATETLYSRKFSILTRLNEKLPYTITTLVQQLESLCGKNEYFLGIHLYTVTVKVGLTARSNFDAVKQLLSRVVPANMIVYLTLKYNTNEKLKPYTHMALSSATYYDWRNEELNYG